MMSMPSAITACTPSWASGATRTHVCNTRVTRMVHECKTCDTYAFVKLPLLHVGLNSLHAEVILS